MLIDFIGMLAAGFAGGGTVMLLNRLTGRRFAKWALPFGVGLAMLAFSIFREYSWFPSVQAQLPDGVVMVSQPQEKYLYRPWTYVVPLSLRFIALDRQAVRVHTNPDVVSMTLYVVQRWAETRKIPVAVDCAGARRADLTDGAALSDAGELTGAAWRDVGADDPLVRAACDRG